MGLSTSLLVLAIIVALIPLAAIGPRPPASLRDLEKGFVFGVVTLGIGTIVVHSVFGLNIFGFFHVLYLLGVVTVPLLLGGWWALGRLRGGAHRAIELGGVLAVLIALLGVWGTHIEPNWLKTDRATLAAPIDASIRVGVLADMQTPDVGRHERNAVDTILAENPDLVLVPGDLFQGPGTEIERAVPDFIELLSTLVDQVPVVAVVSGDSDQPELLQRITEGAGALYIDNQVAPIEVAGQPVRLAGITVSRTTTRLDTLAALGEPSDAYTILLTHRPDAVYELPVGADVDLIVAGHTHGGQIALPFFGPPVTLSEIPRDIAAGALGVIDGYPIYVSAGVGLERNQAPQIRLGVRPEVGILDLIPGG